MKKIKMSMNIYKNLYQKIIFYLHTSGHADFNTIKKVCMTVNPKKIIPIHGNNPEAFTKMRFGKCKYTFIKTIILMLGYKTILHMKGLVMKNINFRSIYKSSRDGF